MVLPARGRAGAVAAAVIHALVAPFLADEVREGEGVLGHVGLLAVSAQAAVLECFLRQDCLVATLN